jgi:hypothetical protein
MFIVVSEENTDSIFRVEGYAKEVVSKKQAASKTSANFYRSTRRCIPEDINFHGHCCENLKSNILM